MKHLRSCGYWALLVPLGWMSSCGGNPHTDAGNEGGPGPGGAGGAATSPECSSRLDCPKPPDARCGTASCIAGVCRIERRTPGPIDSQIRGDCQAGYCDPLGQFILLEDPSDYYDDGNVCTEDRCIDGIAQNVARPDGSLCTSSSSGYCYQGGCVECIGNMPFTVCKGLGCEFFWCVPYSCVDDNLCGVGCKPCVPGKPCKTPQDCGEGVCTAGKCAAPTCTDGVQNGDETGVDCGGPCEERCADGVGCKKHPDCVSGVCWAGLCQAPECTDGVKNGKETGLDCGGSCGPCQE